MESHRSGCLRNHSLATDSTSAFEWHRCPSKCSLKWIHENHNGTNLNHYVVFYTRDSVPLGLVRSEHYCAEGWRDIYDNTKIHHRQPFGAIFKRKFHFSWWRILSRNWDFGKITNIPKYSQIQDFMMYEIINMILNYRESEEIKECLVLDLTEGYMWLFLYIV